MPAEVRDHSLPRPLTGLVGREGELADARRLLGLSRLLTLTGPGGSGKTRLGIELAKLVSAEYPDGTVFVALAAIRDPNLVPSSIARSLGLQDARGRPLLEHLASYLSDRRVLLLLDNFEQLLSAGGVVLDLLACSDGVRIVATSRSPLRVSGEQEYPVPPLAVPPESAAGSLQALMDFAAVSLFVRRACAVAPDFSLDADNVDAVTGIVRRLDGLPLAIELAAARVKHLTPEGILARLDDSLGLLVGGTRDLPDRQQTLRSTIAWSHDLLSDDARMLLAVCSVFRGGIALAGLESICAASVDLGGPVLDSVQELVDQSLLRLASRSPAPRYTMLETVREFAAEVLKDQPVADTVRAAHATEFAALADRLERPPIWPDNEFVTQLDLEHDNLRAALDWLSQHDLPAALRMAGRLTAFWSMRGHFTEGRQRFAELLRAAPEPTPERVGALNGAGWLAMDQGDLDSSRALLDDSVRLAQTIHDEVGLGTALLNRGRSSLGGRGIEEGGRDVQQAFALLTQAGDVRGAAAALMFCGLSPQFTGSLDLACDRYSECADRCAELGLATLRARAMQLLGIARLQLGDIGGARAALTEGVPIVVESGDRFGIAVGLGGLVGLAAATERPRLALRLLGVIDEFAEVNEVMPPQALRDLTDQFLAPVRAGTGPGVEAALRADGRTMTVPDAVAAIFADEPEQAWRATAGPALTRREAEVARLVARGWTNREIAEHLSLSVRTVDVHVERIRTKLGLRTRSQVTAWAHEHGLVDG